MAKLNQCSFIGYIGKDPEQQKTKNGDRYIRFTLAVDQSKEEPPLWLNVTCWNELAQHMQKMLHKGSLVFVQGRLQVRAYKAKNNVERQAIDLVATNVQALEKQPQKTEPAQAA